MSEPRIIKRDDHLVVSEVEMEGNKRKIRFEMSGGTGANWIGGVREFVMDTMTYDIKLLGTHQNTCYKRGVGNFRDEDDERDVSDAARGFTRFCWLEVVKLL